MLRKWMPLTLAMILLLVGATACQKTTTTDQSNSTDTTEETMRMTTQEKMDIFLTRRSIRKYKPELPSQELLDKVLEAGTYAPSAMGKQSATIVAVTNRAVRDQLSQLANKARGGEEDQFYGAPAVLVVLADKSLSDNYLQDGALVVGNMQNAAHALGLGTCWINAAKGIFELEEGQALLKEWGLEGNLVGVACCIIGYPDESPEPAPRKERYVIHVD